MVILFGLIAATPAIAKPELPDHMYRDIPIEIVAMRSCGIKGWLSPELAATGRQLLLKSLQNYEYDETRMGTSMRVVEKRPQEVSVEYCNSRAVFIWEAKANIQAEAPPVQAAPPSNRSWRDLDNTPRTTNCSTYFGQTSCTTY